MLQQASATAMWTDPELAAIRAASPVLSQLSLNEFALRAGILLTVNESAQTVRRMSVCACACLCMCVELTVAVGPGAALRHDRQPLA
jgi:streptolysin S family bacteriocin protoxin